MACNKESLTFLPSANEVAGRECFYTCLLFCSHGGGSVCPIACWDTHPQADTPRADSSPRQTSPGRHPPADTPPGRHPSQQTPLPAETPRQTTTFRYYWKHTCLVTEECALSPTSAAGVRGRDGHDEEHQGIPHRQTSGLQTDSIQTGNTT